MFERFTDDARAVMTAGLGEVQRRQAAAYTPADLLVGVASAGARGQAALARHDLTADRLRELHDLVDSDDLDADALGRIGIDLDAVRRNVESVFGRGALNRRRRQRPGSGGGHVPFAPAAKKALELALREALQGGSNHIDSGFILLGLLRVDDAQIAQMLVAAEVAVPALQQTVRAEPWARHVAGDEPASAMRTPSTSLSGLQLTVRSVDESKSFYDAVLEPLGLAPVAEPAGAVGYVDASGAAGGGGRTVLRLAAAGAGAAPSAVAFTLMSPDRAAVQAFRNAAVLAGADVLNEPHRPADASSGWSSRVRDPDGNAVEALYLGVGAA